MEKVIIVLPSIHDILAIEAHLKLHQLYYDLIPKPTTIASDCGMVVECRATDLAKVVELLTAQHITIMGIFTGSHSKGYDKIA